MQKIIVSSLVAVLLVPAAPVFAQFKNPAKAAKNLANLERLIVKDAQGARKIVPVLTPGAFPHQVTPVSKSWRLYMKNIYGDGFPIVQKFATKHVMIPLPLVVSEWNCLGKTFYEDQATLARDLDTFYRGKADVLKGPDGREVKLYALPVDGILYKPSEYSVPVVLNSQEYFVIYDVAAKTGKIAENIPAVYNLYTPRIYDEIWQAMGASKGFDDLGNLCDAILTAHLHKARIDQLQVTSDIKTLVRNGKQIVFRQLNSSMELLGYLQKLPTVRETTKGFKAYVVELPVEGLSWTDIRDGVTHSYTRKDNVMLFFEMGAVGIYPRADVENPELFTPLD